MRKKMGKQWLVCTLLVLSLGVCACGKTAKEQVSGEDVSVGAENASGIEDETGQEGDDKGMSAENTGLLFGDAIKTLENGITISNDKISGENYKYVTCNNPVSSEFYCADPTAVEYEGRLYLYGTNDHQQFEIVGPDKDNSYEKIKSFLVFSTDDMVNWMYHGEINVGEIAPWIMNSWAPTITSRVEADGLTHFYLYFSNNGIGVGVITATNPLGPWSDPLGKPFISTSTPGLTNCPNPFDPGVVIDDNGDGWLAFGAGKAVGGTDYMPGSARIVKLGEDMLSFASDFVEIPAPYLFEASELNYINGTYVYTYNTDWSSHGERWEYDCTVPSQCSMVYMTTKTPLDSSSWEVKGEYFKNPGLSGFDYSNNHTHLHKFNGNYYIFYHTLMLKGGMGITGSYRSLGVDEIEVDEATVTIKRRGGTKQGIRYVSSVNPFEENLAAELNNTAAIIFDTTNPAEPIVVSEGEGSWISVKNVEFTASGKPMAFLAKVKGKGSVEVRLDKKDGALLTNIDFDTAGEVQSIYNDVVAQTGGMHDLYFVFSSENIEFISWMFVKTEE